MPAPPRNAACCGVPIEMPPSTHSRSRRRSSRPRARPAGAGRAAQDGGEVDAIVDTPKGSPHKYRFDEAHQRFRLTRVLPAGAVFPFNFGYFPGTRAGDGDPLDVLIVMDEALAVGAMVAVRLIGVLEAKQKAPGGEGRARNDRLIAVAAESAAHAEVRDVSDLPPGLLLEVERFFRWYNEGTGKGFEVTGRGGAARAMSLLRAARVS
jgi:inorganic pyrophosphatase